MGREIPSLRHLQDNEGHFIPCHGVTDSFHPIQHVDVFDYIVHDGMPSAGAIGKQGVLGLRA